MEEILKGIKHFGLHKEIATPALLKYILRDLYELDKISLKNNNNTLIDILNGNDQQSDEFIQTILDDFDTREIDALLYNQRLSSLRFFFSSNERPNVMARFHPVSIPGGIYSPVLIDLSKFIDYFIGKTQPIDTMHKCVLELMIRYAFSASEIINIKMHSVDMKSNQITYGKKVKRTITQRTIQIDDFTMNDIEEWISLRNGLYPDSEYLFMHISPGSLGNQLSDRYILRLINLMSDQLNLGTDIKDFKISIARQQVQQYIDILEELLAHLHNRFQSEYLLKKIKRTAKYILDDLGGRVV